MSKKEKKKSITSSERQIHLDEGLQFGERNQTVLEKDKSQEETQIQPSEVSGEETSSEKLIYEESELEEAIEKKKEKRFEFLGIAMFIFAVIGVIATLYFGTVGVINLVNQKGLKEEVQEAVYPLVVTDVPAFDTVDKLDSKTVVQAGIWHFIMNSPDMDKYAKDAFGNLTVPAVDIEVHIKQLFGDGVEITHQMIPDTDFYIPYDEENQCYLIPEDPQLLPYAPKVLSVSKLGDEYQARVGYILPGPFWDLDRHKQDEPNKVMVYTLKKEDGRYTIQSVAQEKTSSLPESGEEAGSSEEILSEQESSGETGSQTESSAAESGLESSSPAESSEEE
jgi:hypothetical protein